MSSEGLGEGVASAVDAVRSYREHRLFSRQVKQERRYTDAHWALHSLSTERWRLRNTGSDTAAQLTLTVRPDQGRQLYVRGALTLVATMFGLRRWRERLQRSEPPTDTYPVHIKSDGPVAAGDSIDLSFPRPPNKRWLDVEWRSPDDSTHWASYLLPLGQTPTGTEQ